MIDRIDMITIVLTAVGNFFTLRKLQVPELFILNKLFLVLESYSYKKGKILTNWN